MKLRLTQPREKQPCSSLVKFFKGEIPENHPASHSRDSQKWPLLISKLLTVPLEDYSKENAVTKYYSQIILIKMGSCLHGSLSKLLVFQVPGLLSP